MLTRLATVLALAVLGTAAPASAADALRKPAYAKWSTPVVNVYVDPSAKVSGWRLNRALRAWSAGPVSLKVVSDRTKAAVTITEIPRHPDYWGNARYAHFDGVLSTCDITLTDNTPDRRRLHVAAHEIGHCLGLPHVQEYHSVMDAWLSGDYSVPTALDLDWLTYVYAH